MRLFFFDTVVWGQKPCLELRRENQAGEGEAFLQTAAGLPPAV